MGLGTLTDEADQFATYPGNDAIVSPTFPEWELTAAQVLVG